jgi:hypothetical protein
LTGNGTGGAYHAGVLRALHEAGIKIDVMSGRGIGVVCALFAAIDAGAKTWEDGGVWRRRPAVRIYQWRTPLYAAAMFALAGVAALFIPLVVLAVALVAYPLSFLLQMINVDAGLRLASAYADMVRYAFAAAVLPTVVPRLVMLCFACAFAVLAVAAFRFQPPPAVWSAAGDGGARGHRDRGRWWARMVGAPWTPEPGLRHFRAALWQLFQGPASAREPGAPDLSRRYAELLFENLGQPGFRELIMTTVDICLPRSESRGGRRFCSGGGAT